MEQKEDLRQNRFSWVIILGRQRAIHLYNILTITSLFISATAAIHVGQFDFTVLMSCYATNILLHYLLSTKFNSMNHQTIRIISELLFWLPIIILLYKIL
jgi:1,4-dihydroxy-2-naphthoate octaprenyltransferase